MARFIPELLQECGSSCQLAELWHTGRPRENNDILKLVASTGDERSSRGLVEKVECTAVLRRTLAQIA